MRLTPKLSMTVAAVLGLSLILGCRQPTATSSVTTPASSTTEKSDSTVSVSSNTDATETKAVDDIPPAVFTDGDIAIRGADPVAYFTQERYVAGTADYTYEWADAVWQFSSAENRDLFASNPTQYAPQYGGFCAWAIAEGYTAPVDPEAWRIVDGKLYLNYDARIQNRWQQDIAGNIVRADQNWPSVLN